MEIRLGGGEQIVVSGCVRGAIRPEKQGRGSARSLDPAQRPCARAGGDGRVLRHLHQPREVKHAGGRQASSSEAVVRVKALEEVVEERRLASQIGGSKPGSGRQARLQGRELRLGQEVRTQRNDLRCRPNSKGANALHHEEVEKRGRLPKHVGEVEHAAEAGGRFFGVAPIGPRERIGGQQASGDADWPERLDPSIDIEHQR